MNTTNTTKNLQTELTDLQQHFASKEADLKLKYHAAQLTVIDIENIIIYSGKTIGFGWRTPLTKEQVLKVSECYPVNGNNYEMKFANSSKNFMTDSPLVIKWHNYDMHTEKELNIEYPSNEVSIKIRVAPSYFGSHVYYNTRNGKHIGFGKYETYRDLHIDYFYTQSYSGGSNTLYFLEGAEKLNEYINWALTGEFKYACDLK